MQSTEPEKKKNGELEASSELVVVGHFREVSAIRFSGDGRFVTSDSFDGTTIVWDCETGACVRHIPFTGRRGGASQRENARLWSAMAKFERILRRLDLQRLGWRHEQVSPDGVLFAEFIGRYREQTCDHEVFLCIAEMETGRILHRTPCMTASDVYSRSALAFSADGELLAASVETEEGIQVWNLRTQETWQVLPGEEVRLFGAALAPGIRLVAVSPDGRRIWNVETGKLIHEDAEAQYAPPLDAPHTVLDSRLVMLSPDGTRLATNIKNGVVSVRERETGRTLIWQTQSGEGDCCHDPQGASLLDFRHCLLRCLTFSPDGHTLATGGSDHQVRLWNAGTGELLHTLGCAPIVVKSLSFTPDDRTLIALSDDGILRTWSLEAATLAAQEPLPLPELLRTASQPWETMVHLWRQGRIGALAEIVLPQGAQLAAVSQDGALIAYKQEDRIVLLDRVRQTQRWTLALQRDDSGPWGYRRTSVIFSPDSRFVAVLGNGDIDSMSLLRLFDLEASENSLEIAQDSVSCLFSSDSRALMVVHQDDLLTPWDIRTGTRGETFPSAQRGPECISVAVLSPDGSLLGIAPCYDETVWIQRPGSREGIALCGHDDKTHAIAFSHDGTRVATGSADGTIKLWETSQGALLATLLVLPGEEWVIFTSDGRYAASDGAAPYLRRRIDGHLLPIETHASPQNNLSTLS